MAMSRLVSKSKYVFAPEDKTLKVWDLETGRELRSLQGHSDPVYGVAASPDGQRAVSVSDDNTLKVWDLEVGTTVVTFTCDVSAQCCEFTSAHGIVAGDRARRLSRNGDHFRYRRIG
jgi:WD40 repeat protein